MPRRAAAASAAASAAAAGPQSSRWSPVSASKNADEEYRKFLAKPDRDPYLYVCVCNPLDEDEDEEMEDDDDDEDEDGEEDEDDEDEDMEDDDDGDEEGEGSKGGPHGKKCVCRKPASGFPDHPWKITLAAVHKLASLHIQTDLRNPDLHDMYTFNDHWLYGVLQVVQNQILDFIEAEDSWQEQLATCEATALWLLMGNLAQMAMVELCDDYHATNLLLGRMFLTLLTRLEREGRVGDIPSLGTAMGLWISLADEMRGSDGFPEREEHGGGKKTKGRFRFQEDEFDAYIAAFAKKHGIQPRGPSHIDELVAQLEEVALPAASNRSPWAWEKYSTVYIVRQTGVHLFTCHGSSKSRIGGDSLDVTTWTSAERKKYSFSKKDPLPKEVMENIKQGMVMALA